MAGCPKQGGEGQPTDATDQGGQASSANDAAGTQGRPTMDKASVGKLCEKLETEDTFKAADAAEALADSGDTAAVTPLLKALASDDERLRAASAFALGKLGDKKAVDALALLED